MNNMLLGSLGSLTPAAPCEGSTMMCDHSEFYYGRTGEGAEPAGFVLNLMFGMSDAGSGLVNWLVPGGDPLPIYGPAHADYQWAYTGGKMLVEGAVIEAAIMATAAEVFRFSRLVSTSGTINKLDDVAGVLGNPLVTSSDEAVFWSGLGKDGQYIAADWAGKNSGKTLEMVLGERGIALPSTSEGWRELSLEFARGAQGDVIVLQADIIRTESIWAQAEWSALRLNPGVTSISAVDPRTGVSTLLWRR